MTEKMSADDLDKMLTQTAQQALAADSATKLFVRSPPARQNEYY